MSAHTETTHITPYRVFVTVWVALILLTGITVSVTALDLGKLSTFTAVMIASVKASLVLLYFMHVRFEARLIQIIFLVTVISFAVFIFLTFADYSFR
ncbi:MAG: cytochrome C oxidase subunit IV family protein [Verrucomicrobiota bacterium]|jgi:cytochrome c oxidase subunit 4|nr:cytochrome C oxidase subunit IV family protein [Verrucomicrobiota bacterium]MDD8050525.1 cytochrome C oxidase subunit IV family protein [Verrucomicrobiota bacterium]